MQSLETLKHLAVFDREEIEHGLALHDRLRAAGRFADMAELYSTEAVLELLGNPRYFAYAGLYAGRDAIINAFQRMGTEIEFLEANMLDVLIDCDRAMMRTRAKLRHRGTGFSLTQEIWDIFRFEAGLIVRQTKYIDLQTFDRLCAGQ